MIHVPNALTVLRLALIPVVALALIEQAYAIALPIFLVAALTDLADGYIARRFSQTTRLGATLDPIADKLSMFVTTVILAWHDLLPAWLAWAIIGRDIFILVGAVAYRWVTGRLDIAPTMLSKINTAIEFAVLLLAMASGAGWIDAASLRMIFPIAFATVVASGAQYAWVWGRKAADERRAQ